MGNDICVAFWNSGLGALDSQYYQTMISPLFTLDLTSDIGPYSHGPLPINSPSRSSVRTDEMRRVDLNLVRPLGPHLLQGLFGMREGSWIFDVSEADRDPGSVAIS